MKDYQPIQNEFAIVQPNNTSSGQNAFSAANGALPAKLKTGIIKSAIFRARFYDAAADGRNAFVFSIGKGLGTSQIIALMVSGGSVWAAKVRSNAVQDITGGTLAKQDREQDLLVNLDFENNRYDFLDFFGLYATGSLNAAHDFSAVGFTEEMTFLCRENSGGAGGQMQGFMLGLDFWIPDEPLTQEQILDAGSDIRTSGTSIILPDTDKVIKVYPDDVDRQAGTVRNQVAAYPFVFSANGDAIVSPIGGHRTGAFHCRGVGGGNSHWFGTGQSEDLSVVTKDFWIEAECLPDRAVTGTTNDTICSDDNNALDIYNDGVNDVFRWTMDINGTPETVNSQAVSLEVPHYIMCGIDGGNLFINVDEVDTIGPAVGARVNGIAFTIGAHSEGGDNFRGSIKAVRYTRFNAGETPTTKQRKQCILQHKYNFVKRHAILQDLLNRNKASCVTYSGKGLKETPAGQVFVWEAESINTVDPFHHMSEFRSLSNTPLIVGDTSHVYQILEVGDPDSGASATPSIPYVGNSAISSAETDRKIPGTAIRLGDNYDYKANGSQNLTTTVGGRGNWPSRYLGGFGSNADYIAPGADEILFLMQGFEINGRAAGNNIGAGAFDHLTFVGIGSNDSVAGRGFEGNGNYLNFIQCVFDNNFSDGCRAINTDCKLLGSITMRNGGVGFAGGATSIVDKNAISDGTSGAFTATYSIDDELVLTDPDTNDYTHTLASVGKWYADEMFLPHNSLGPFGYFLKEGNMLTWGVVEVPKFGQIEFK